MNVVETCTLGLQPTGHSMHPYACTGRVPYTEVIWCLEINGWHLNWVNGVQIRLGFDPPIFDDVSCTCQPQSMTTGMRLVEASFPVPVPPTVKPV